MRVVFFCQKRDSSRGRHREKEDIKITKERTPASEEETADWEANREGEHETQIVFFSVPQGTVLVPRRF